MSLGMVSFVVMESDQSQMRMMKEDNVPLTAGGMVVVVVLVVVAMMKLCRIHTVENLHIPFGKFLKGNLRKGQSQFVLVGLQDGCR